MFEKVSLSIYAAKTDCLQNEDVFSKAYRLASKDRREKIDRMKHKQAASAGLCAELLLLYALSITCTELSDDTTPLVFSYGPNGKPYLSHAPHIFFNLSHSYGGVLCAVAPFEIGCDIEKIRDTRLDVAHRVFSDAEQALLNALSNETEKKNLFFELWTKKESFMKATGEGFLALSSNTYPNDFYFTSLNIWDGYACHLCAKDPAITNDIPIIYPDLSRFLSS